LSHLIVNCHFVIVTLSLSLLLIVNCHFVIVTLSLSLLIGTYYIMLP
jgi:hypothetical protein